MVGINHANAVLDNRGLVFNQRVRGQTAEAFTDAHGTAGRMEPQSDVRSRSNRIIQTAAVGIQIQMVRRQRAPRQSQFSQPNLCRDIHFFGTKPRPNRVQRPQPAEQKRVLRAWDGARQGLVQVMMRVHEAGCHQTPLSVQHIRPGPRLQPNADLGNNAILDPHVSAIKAQIRVIHR